MIGIFHVESMINVYALETIIDLIDELELKKLARFNYQSISFHSYMTHDEHKFQAEEHIIYIHCSPCFCHLLLLLFFFWHVRVPRIDYYDVRAH